MGRPNKKKVGAGRGPLVQMKVAFSVGYVYRKSSEGNLDCF